MQLTYLLFIINGIESSGGINRTLTSDRMYFPCSGRDANMVNTFMPPFLDAYFGQIQAQFHLVGSEMSQPY